MNHQYHIEYMTLDMNDDHIMSVAQLTEFVKLETAAKFKSKDNRTTTYEWINTTLNKFRYRSLKKKEKSIVKKYLMTMTGYSEGSIDKLIRKKKKHGRIVVSKRTQNSFTRFYEPSDIALLAEISNITLNQNGYALKAMCVSMYREYGDVRFEHLAKISVSHLYNLKKTRIYESASLHCTKTNPVQRDIGIRRKPLPYGRPGYIRVDSVHQGDMDKEKGVYHINMVDEVTQMEYVGCVEGISEYFLLPLLEKLLDMFPCEIIEFHSDNGSEYVNYQVATLLNKLHIDQTKSRARQTNDNALVECKNGSVVRKYMGYTHIPRKHADRINQFYFQHLNPYLNHHRFCGFATDYVDMKGKVRKKYETYLTPIQKLVSIPEFERYLKPAITKDSLDSETQRMTHVEAAQKVFAERQKLFKEISQKL